MEANAENSAAGSALRPASPVGAEIAGELRRVATSSRPKINSENFPVALRLLPREARDRLLRVYEFARFVDDVGDTAVGDRLALLDAVDADIAALRNGVARCDPVRNLAPLVSTGIIAVQPLHDLVEANRRDQTVHSYQTFDDLMDYCSLSAAPVGRLVLALAGVQDAGAITRSDNVCAALQVLEHCQDVGEDAANGRVYLPAVDLRAAGVDPADLRTGSTSGALREVLERQVERAEGLLLDGRPLIAQLRSWPRIAVLGYVAGGRATALALRRAQFDVLSRPITPSRAGALAQALRLVAGR